MDTRRLIPKTGRRTLYLAPFGTACTAQGRKKLRGEEMEKVGGAGGYMPALPPAELWQETWGWENMALNWHG